AAGCIFWHCGHAPQWCSRDVPVCELPASAFWHSHERLSGSGYRLRTHLQAGHTQLLRRNVPEPENDLGSRDIPAYVDLRVSTRQRCTLGLTRPAVHLSLHYVPEHQDGDGP